MATSRPRRSPPIVLQTANEICDLHPLAADRSLFAKLRLARKNTLIPTPLHIGGSQLTQRPLRCPISRCVFMHGAILRAERLAEQIERSKRGDGIIGTSEWVNHACEHQKQRPEHPFLIFKCSDECPLELGRPAHSVLTGSRTTASSCASPFSSLCPVCRKTSSGPKLTVPGWQYMTLDAMTSWCYSDGA
jgi:hypothetical protein